MDNALNTKSLPMHTLTFESANKMHRETYHCADWNQFHVVNQAMDKRGFTRVEWIDRCKGHVGI